jgi:NADP-dependent aldehyde dehydrogenase
MENTEATKAFIASVAAQMQEKPEGVLLNDAIESGLQRAVNATKTKSSIRILTGGEAVENSGFYCYRNTVMQTTSAEVRADNELQIEHFGPVTLFVLCDDMDDLKQTITVVEGNLTTTIHAEDDEVENLNELIVLMREKSGRVIWNGFPTGVAVVYSMQHGGPYPATTAPATTSVGMNAIYRFMRPIAFQAMPEALLPDALKDDNPLGIMRIVDNVHNNSTL